MQLFKNKKVSHLALATFMAVSGLLTVGLAQHTQAAALSQVAVRFDRLKASQATTGTVCVKPATTSTDVKSWSVTFPTGFTVSATAGNWQSANISTSNLSWPGTSPTAWPNATSATASVTGQTVTWTNSSAQSMNNTSTYCYNWTNASAISEPSSTGSSELGSVTTTDSSSVTIDTAQYATATVTDDQIVVTATVAPTFSFALSANTDPLGTLSPSAVTHGASITATVGTNAKNGWNVWAKSALTNGGLRSATASYTIPSNCSSGTGSNSTLSTAAEGYNTGITSSHAAGGNGTITVNGVFDGTATSQGGGLCGAFQSLATSSGTAVGDVLTLKNNVAITSATAAATDYTDTITVIGAGLF